MKFIGKVQLPESRKGVADKFAMKRWQEQVAKIKDCVDIGVGPGAMEEMGMTEKEVGFLILENINRIGNTYSRAQFTFVSGRKVSLYVRRRGRSLDVSNRSDLKLLGHEKIADIFDAIDRGESDEELRKYLNPGPA